MPRKKIDFEEKDRPVNGALLSRLVEELSSSRDLGQPVIHEQTFPTGKIRVTVIWDQWDHVSFEDRTSLILRAYELAEGPDYRENIALASGLTVPEAYTAGMLPFAIIPALRKGDPVSADQCRQTMIEAGASRLLEPDQLQLRFASLEEAQAVRDQLVQRLPASEPVWVITQELSRVDEFSSR